jgi:hypothetical protein
MRVQLAFQLGSTSAITGNVSFALPDGALTVAGMQLGHLVCVDGSVQRTGHVWKSTSSGSLVILYGGVGNVNATTPFTWTTGDQIWVDITVDLQS